MRLAALAAAAATTFAQAAWAQEAGEPVRALLVPRNNVVMSSQIAGRIERIAFEDGETFRRGEVLVEMDCRLQTASLQRARAEVAAAERTLSARRRLRDLQSGSDLDLALAETALEKAKADLSAAAATVDMCALRAPYDGRVVERRAEPHQHVSAGQALIEIMDDGVLEIELFVPSTWLAQLAPGAAFSVRIDETGREYPARILRLGARIDPASQSVRVTGALDRRAPELLPGMSGVARFEVP